MKLSIVSERPAAVLPVDPGQSRDLAAIAWKVSAALAACEVRASARRARRAQVVGS